MVDLLRGLEFLLDLMSTLRIDTMGAGIRRTLRDTG
jgi:hypothetical protein